MKSGHRHLTRRLTITALLLASASIFTPLSLAEEKVPAKAEAVRILRNLLTALEQTDYLTALSFIRLPLNA